MEWILAAGAVIGWFARGRYDDLTSEEWELITEYRRSGMICGRHPVSGLVTSVAPPHTVAVPKSSW